MDFVCVEDVTEKIDLSRDNKNVESSRFANFVAAIEAQGGSRGRPLPFNREDHARRDNKYLFDYQFIRRGGSVTERRVLLEKNGKKASGGEEIPKTETFQYSDILFSPIRLLDDKNAEFYGYRLKGEDAVDGQDAWLLEVTPRMAIADRYLGAVIWLKKFDASVLRIDWDPATFGSYENILARAHAFGSEPAVVSRTEFGIEKNGLRFPSVDFTEEAYSQKSGEKFIRATTRVSYSRYKFFVVESETGVAR